jgi:hypothetical protein
LWPAATNVATISGEGKCPVDTCQDDADWSVPAIFLKSSVPSVGESLEEILTNQKRK